MDPVTLSPRLRSDSSSSSASQGSKSKMFLRQRLNQLLTCIEDMSSDEEASEEVSRTLDEAFQLCGRFVPTDSFRWTHVPHRFNFCRSITSDKQQPKTRISAVKLKLLCHPTGCTL